ncbi:hypothetical protein ACSSS7_004284 [Eimeria intestinalis]
MALFARRGVVRQARKTKAESSEDEEGLQEQDRQSQQQQQQQPRAAVLKAAAAAAAGMQVTPHQAAAMAQTADSIRRSAALTAAKSHAAAAAVAAALPAELQLVDANFESALRELDEPGDTQQMLLQQQQQQYQQQQPKKKLLAAGACAVGSSRVFAQQQQQQQVLLQQQQAAAASAKAQRLSFGFADEEGPTAQRGAAAAVRESLEEELPVGRPARLGGSRSSRSKGSSKGSTKGGGDSRRSASNSSRDAEVRGTATTTGSRASQEKSLLVVNPPGSVGIVLKATHGSSSSSSSSSSVSKRHEFAPTSKANTSRLASSSKSSRSESGVTEKSAAEARRREVGSGAAAAAPPAAAAAAAAASPLTVESRIFSLAEIEARGSAAAAAAAAAVEEVPDIPFAALAQVARRSRQQARAADSTVGTSSNKKSVTPVASYGGNGSDDEAAPTGGSSSSSNNSWLAKEAMMQLRAGRLLQELSVDDEEQAALEAWEREQIMKGAGRKQLLLQQQKLERRQRQQQEQLQLQQEQLILSSFTGIGGPHGVSAASPLQGALSSLSNSSSLVRPAPEPRRPGGLPVSPETAADCFRQLWASSGAGTNSSSNAEQQAAAAVAWIEEQAEHRAEEQQQYQQQQQQQVQYKKAAATRLTALEVKQLNEKRPAVKMAVEALHELEAADANRRYGPRLKQRRQQQPLGNVLRQLRGAPNPASAEAVDVFAAARSAASAAAAAGEGGEVDPADLGRSECWAEVLDSALFTSDEEGPVVSSSSNSSTKRHKTQRQFLQAAAEIFADVLPKYKEVRCIVEAFAAACRNCPEDLAALQQQVPLLQQLQRCAETICSWELLWWLPMDLSLAPTTPAIAAAAVEWLKQQQQHQEQQRQQQELEEATNGEKKANSSGKLQNGDEVKDSDGAVSVDLNPKSGSPAEDPAPAATAASAATAARGASAAIAAALDSGSGPLYNGSVVGGRILRGGPDVADFEFVKSIFAFSQEMEALSETRTTNTKSSGSSSVSEVAAAFSDILLFVVKDVVFPRALHALQQTDCCSFTAAAAAAALLQEMLLFRAPPTEAAVMKMLQLFVTSFLSTLDSQLPVHCVTRALQQHQQHQQQQQQQPLQEGTETGQLQQMQQEAFTAAAEVYVHRTLKAVGVTAFFEGILSEPLLLHICMHHLFELRLQPLLQVLPQRNALLAIHGFVRLLPVKRLLLLQQQQQQQQLLLLVNSCLTVGADLTDETHRAELLLLLHRISPQELSLLLQLLELLLMYPWSHLLPVLSPQQHQLLRDYPIAIIAAQTGVELFLFLQQQQRQ